MENGDRLAPMAVVDLLELLEDQEKMGNVGLQDQKAVMPLMAPLALKALADPKVKMDVLDPLG